MYKDKKLKSQIPGEVRSPHPRTQMTPLVINYKITGY